MVKFYLEDRVVEHETAHVLYRPGVCGVHVLCAGDHCYDHKHVEPDEGSEQDASEQFDNVVAGHQGLGQEGLDERRTERVEYVDDGETGGLEGLDFI
jgi:hypothetical protein